MDAIEAAGGRVVGSYYGEGGTLLPIEEINTMMDSFQWDGGYRIVDSPSMELWNAMDLWPAAPGVFVLSTEDMTVVASEATGVQLDLVAEAEALNN
jgi:hypothetical protein